METHKTTLLVLRMIGSCILTLSVCGLWYGSFSVTTFVLAAVLGLVAGFVFHIWDEHLIEKFKNECPTEKEKQRLSKMLSMGKKKFVFIYGILFWGIGMAILFGVSEVWRSRMVAVSFLDRFLSFRSILVFIMFLILGTTAGLIMWNGIQKTARKYHMHLNEAISKNQI